MKYAETSRRRGPRVGRPDLRHHILDIARRRFRADGYRAVTLRAVADEADVDVALISYYFGSKSGLFAASVELPRNPPELLRQALRGDPNSLPERILRTLVTTWDDPARGAPLVLMLTAAVQEPAVARLLRELVEREIIDTLVDHLGGVHARRKAAAASTQVVGLLFTRYVLALEPVASMSADEIVTALAPGLRAALLAPARHR